LKFTNIRKSDDGLGMSFDVATTNEEVVFLVNHAVQDLLREGIITVLGDQDQEVALRESDH
jgi:hypothetical protein